MPNAPKSQQSSQTHEVINQPSIQGDHNLVDDCQALNDAMKAAFDPALFGQIHAYGAFTGSREAQEHSRLAERNTPELVAYDNYGNRIDRVDYHPSYHALHARGRQAGMTRLPWKADKGHSAHAAQLILTFAVEPGVCCPLTMTYAGTASLSQVGETAWVEGLTAADYDPAFVAPALKSALSLGMAMTEKQGGSDVRANSTRAELDGDQARLTGHKWFCSAPMSDGFLTLANVDDKLTCFLVPRVLPDGSINEIRIRRLKDKLGNKSNASAEIEYERAFATPVGDVGDGVRSILNMVHHTRLSTAAAPVGLMMRATHKALHHIEHRTAFQKRLIDQPLMRSVAADLALEVEAATALIFWVGECYDRADAEEDQAGMARLLVALAKFLLNKRAPGHVVEALECLGGSGYVEESGMPMLFRESPLNGIWEGTGNVIVLDILRTMEKLPETRKQLADTLMIACRQIDGFDAAMQLIERLFGRAEQGTRTDVFILAQLCQAAALVKAGKMDIAAAFVKYRLLTGHRLYGVVTDVGHQEMLLGRWTASSGN